MAEFSQAISKTLLFEGGYSHNLVDTGGETYQGVSRNNWPKWEGWFLIDLAKTQAHFPVNLTTNSQLQGLVIQFYRCNFWQYDRINDQDVANKVFDLSVNVGKKHGVKILQEAAGVETDGKYGPKTEAAVNAHLYGSLTPIIRIAAENYHKEVVATHPEDAIFLMGWLRRDDS
jgi:lysozyme family protein